MKLRKCKDCRIYTLKEKCKCGKPTVQVSHKFIKIKANYYSTGREQ